jgi:uncharacterized protein YdhG (YjbR/CyaY superfamily)
MTIKVLYAKLPPHVVQALKLLKLNQIEDLSGYSKESISCLHGIGSNAIKIIEKEMSDSGVSFSVIADKKRTAMCDDINLIDSYIELYPGEIQQKLREIRLVIKNIAPLATEKLSYNYPTFYYLGNLVQFSGSEHFIGFNPLSDGLYQFRDEISKFNTTKGFIRFPTGEPLPRKLIESIVLFRIAENEKKKNDNGLT